VGLGALNWIRTQNRPARSESPAVYRVRDGSEEGDMHLTAQLETEWTRNPTYSLALYVAMFNVICGNV
jgi:hypothetical protein